jgi:hypothetical protein
MLKEVPAWILRLTSWDLIGVIAYTQAFALFESLLLFIFLYLLGLVLPFQWEGNRFAAQSAVVVFVTASWSVVAHLNDQAIRTWAVKEFLPWALAYFLSIVLAFGVVQRIRTVENIVLNVVERLTALALIYLFIDLVSVLIVIVRNI